MIGKMMAAWALGASALCAQAQTVAAAVEEKVVYHVDDMSTAREALFNMNNHLAASPAAKITLVANGKGILMLVAGEGDKLGEYASAIQSLQAKGVRFEACRNSMTSRNIESSALVKNVQIVPAGVVELARLQLVEHYAYIKP